MLSPPTIVPKVGGVVSTSARIRPGTYALVGGEAVPALTVRGDDIVVDFTGVILRGLPAKATPNARRGIGLLVEGRNVTVKGLRAHGYRIGLLARQAPRVRLLDCDLSYNGKPNPERQGFGACLDRCDGFEVRALRVTGGQGGLFLDRSNRGLVWNCDLSSNSALGLGMLQASGNRVMHNRLDHDGRGASDSAAILASEGCGRNVFAYNSATHGGRGLSLGAVGCDDNLVYANDFSHATTSGIEAASGRNAFVGNRVHDTPLGLRGGDLSGAVLVGNEFAGNRSAVEIVRGQGIEIALNSFLRDDVAIAFGTAAPGRDLRIVGNLFRDVPLALDLRSTTNTLLEGNVFDAVARPVRAEGEPFSPLPMENDLAGATPETGLPGTKRRVRSERNAAPWDPLRLPEGTEPYRIAPLKGGRMPFLPKAVARPRLGERACERRRTATIEA